VEKKIGEIKRNLALDYRRNTELGHLQVDYRIACAMINYLHKPCQADKHNAENISRNLLKRMRNPKLNILNSLLQFDFRLSTKLVPATKLSNITDFPKLSKKKMVQKIFFGSYYLKACKSYMVDLLRNNLICEIDIGVLSTIQEKNMDDSSRKIIAEALKISKIIGCEIDSRHSRSVNPYRVERNSGQEKFDKKFKKRYKVFVQYVPFVNRSKSIKCKFKSNIF
jgi:hypothetical protein